MASAFLRIVKACCWVVSQHDSNAVFYEKITKFVKSTETIYSLLLMGISSLQLPPSFCSNFADTVGDARFANL
jgi:hypothetical protein